MLIKDINKHSTQNECSRSSRVTFSHHFREADYVPQGSVDEPLDVLQL